MAPLIFVFTRDIENDEQILRQNVSVFAGDQKEAEKVLRINLERWRSKRGQGPDVRHVYEAADGWSVNVVELDNPKIVLSLLTH